MKKFVLLVFAVWLACSACKLETSSAGPNSNSNANANANPSSDAGSEGNQQRPANCSLTFAAAPAVDGLKLRMTPDELMALFPGSREDEEVRGMLARPTSQFGATDLIIRPQKFESKDKFPGVNQIVVTFLDGRIHRLHIAYNGPQYSDVDQLLNKFIPGTSLPAADQWYGYPGLDTQMKTLTCKDFEVRAFIGGENGNQNYVQLTDLEAEKKLKDRRAKAMANASPTPTPST